MMVPFRRRVVLLAAALLAAGAMASEPARAGQPAANDALPTFSDVFFTLLNPKSSLLNPTPDSALRPLSTDRPPKANVAQTVDAGHFQIESDLANFTYDNTAGIKTRSFEALDPAYKLGLTSSIDLEVEFNGLQSVSSGDNLSPTMHAQGFGDVFLRSKINFIGNDSGDLAIAAIPYVKAPSQRAVISNGVVEGGVIIPISYKLPNDFVLLFDPEFDALKNANNSGRHANFTNLVNISHPVPGIKNLTAFAEVFASVPAERASPNVYTADFALAYLVNPSLQLDAGTNVGLNRAAPDIQVYTGISVRY